ncbi:MAG: hypothetical protein L0Z62_22875 [Gemmataceae bacterium]|nr:hypothetical protein [Gemmataceae bacterium]
MAVLEAVPPGDLRPELEGYAHRFTLLLPLLSATGRRVFTGHHCALLSQLFNRRFGGCLESATEGHPPWHGSWLPEGAEAPILDRHMLFIVYSAQRAEAMTFFQYLKWVLQREWVAGQEVVVIEHSTVWLVEATPLPGFPAE